MSEPLSAEEPLRRVVANAFARAGMGTANIGVVTRYLVDAGVAAGTPDWDALRRAAKAVVRDAEPDDDFDGQFVEYLVPSAAIDALRDALATGSHTTQGGGPVADDPRSVSEHGRTFAASGGGTAALATLDATPPPPDGLREALEEVAARAELVWESLRHEDHGHPLYDLGRALAALARLTPEDPA